MKRSILRPTYRTCPGRRFPSIDALIHNLLAARAWIVGRLLSPVKPLSGRSSSYGGGLERQSLTRLGSVRAMKGRSESVNPEPKKGRILGWDRGKTPEESILRCRDESLAFLVGRRPILGVKAKRAPEAPLHHEPFGAHLCESRRRTKVVPRFPASRVASRSSTPRSSRRPGPDAGP